MKWSSLFLIFLFSFVLFSLYILLNLNNGIVTVDLLFYEMDLSMGVALIGSFLIGSLVTFVLEVTYFSVKKKGKRNE
mgnify:CR=1 FL=1|tara:strand:+ start:4570 stop:4800 length:231 start_codon:yes stop_codon:yes gene_type:complete